MDCETWDGGAICGNFAELLPEQPKDFDYSNTGKWMQGYPFEKREVIGGTACNCKKVECHYAPYYGFDYYHNKNCNLTRKVTSRPGLMNLWAYEHLPAIRFSDQAAEFDGPIPLYVETSSRTSRVTVRRSPQRDARQVALL